MKGAAVLVLVALTLGACAGPSSRVELVNNSRTWLSATVWTPAADSPGRYLPAHAAVVPPGARLAFSARGLDAKDPARVQVEALGPDLKTPPSIWYELPAPGPVRLEAHGQGSELWFERRDGVLTPLTPLASALLPKTDRPPESPRVWLPTLGPEVPEPTPVAPEATLPKPEQSP